MRISLALLAALALVGMPAAHAEDPTMTMVDLNPIEIDAINVHLDPQDPGRTYLLRDATVTPGLTLLPVDTPPVATPNVPATPPVDMDRFDVPAQPERPTPDFQGVGPVETPDYPGTPEENTDPVDAPVASLNAEREGEEVCFDVHVMDQTLENTCFHHGFFPVAEPSGDLPLVHVPSQTIPSTDPVGIPDTPTIGGREVPDVPALPGVDFNDVPATPGKDVQDVPGIPAGTLGSTARYSVDLFIEYETDCSQYRRWAGLDGPGIDVVGPAPPGLGTVEWLQGPGAGAAVTLNLVLYQDGSSVQSARTASLPYGGQLYGWAIDHAFDVC